MLAESYRQSARGRQEPNARAKPEPSNRDGPKGDTMDYEEAFKVYDGIMKGKQDGGAAREAMEIVHSLALAMVDISASVADILMRTKGAKK